MDKYFLASKIKYLPKLFIKLTAIEFSVGRDVNERALNLRTGYKYVTKI